ncbi:MAG: IclR family transcriptional regulator [Acidimicrobiaceae bacterium]|nr:IclR family transcriptional regulator [Acidimicrobiaceae bacterium]
MSVQSIERAFSLLRALAVGPVGVTDLAERVDLPKSTVARLLAALEMEGAVSQIEAGGEYRLGEGLLDIAGATQPGRNLVATVRPHLIELTDFFGETAGLSIESERDVYYLDHVEAQGDVQVRSWTGDTLPIHSVPSGLCMMAHWPANKLANYLEAPLESPTAYTLTNADEIGERIGTIQSLGYAWGYEEGVDGINSVAAPIVLADGTVEGAVHIHGPAFRFPTPDRTHDLGVRLVTAAETIAEHFND